MVFYMKRTETVTNPQNSKQNINLPCILGFRKQQQNLLIELVKSHAN